MVGRHIQHICPYALAGLPDGTTEAARDEAMKAISLMQPWATLMALEEKLAETRGQLFTALDPVRNHGEPVLVAICASKTWKADQAELMDHEPFRSTLGRRGIIRNSATHSDMPRGTITGVARCVKAAPSDSPQVKRWLEGRPMTEGLFGNYEPNRWIYICDRVWKTHSQMIFVKGRLGVFDLPPDVEHRLLVDLQHHEDLPDELTSEALLAEAMAEAERREYESAEANWLLGTLRGNGERRKRDTRTAIDRMIDKAVGRGR